VTSAESDYLSHLASLSLSFVGFSAVIVTLRSALGGELSDRHLLGSAWTSQQTDEDEIRKIQTRWDDAWNRHDIKALGALVAEDVRFVNVRFAAQPFGLPCGRPRSK
jgi:hypothetical protein